ncbi:MAG: hypothetical protein V7K67_09065 [Nostoc sp.]
MLCLVKVWDAIASSSASALIVLSADDGGIEEECLRSEQYHSATNEFSVKKKVI